MSICQGHLSRFKSNIKVRFKNKCCRGGIGVSQTHLVLYLVYITAQHRSRVSCIFQLQLKPKASELLSWHCVCCASICSLVRAFLNFSSPQKLLTGFLPNFTRKLLRWSSFKFIQIIVLCGCVSVVHEEFWLLWQSK